MNVLLSVDHLSVRYASLLALDRINLDIAEGARHALIGPNGAGKTTLLHTIAGTIRPTLGTIRLAGRDITRLGPAPRARLGITRTFQTPALCTTLTALDNVILGTWSHTRVPRTRGGWWPPTRYRQLATRSLHLLDQLGLAEFATTPAGQLPHGQQRLLDIATALAGRPRLLLLDEPAAGLSDADLLRLIHCLHALPDHVAMLLVEHHLDLVTAVASTITVIHHGQTLTTGTPAQVTTNPKVTAAYLTTPDPVS